MDACSCRLGHKHTRTVSQRCRGVPSAASISVITTLYALGTLHMIRIIIIIIIRIIRRLHSVCTLYEIRKPGPHGCEPFIIIIIIMTEYRPRQFDGYSLAVRRRRRRTGRRYWGKGESRVESREWRPEFDGLRLPSACSLDWSHWTVHGL